MIYEVHLSKGNKVKIDEDDLNKIKENLSSNFIQVKMGIINPSFIISIIPIEETDSYQEKVYRKIIDESGNLKVIEDGYKTVKKIVAGVNKEGRNPMTNSSLSNEIML